MEANPLNARCPTTAGHAFYCGCGERVVTPLTDLPDKVKCPNCEQTRKVYACGWCEEAGHNRRRCITLARQKALRLRLGRVFSGDADTVDDYGARIALKFCDTLFADPTAHSTPHSAVRRMLALAGRRLAERVVELSLLQADLDFYLCGGNLTESNDQHATEARY